MIIMFFLLSTIVFLCTSLAIIMFSNNLKRINKSIEIYLDVRAYKPENEIKFLTSLFHKCEGYALVHPTDIDIPALVKICFYEQKIGIFSTSKVESVANKGKELLWFSTITMTLFEVINPSFGESILNLILIVISAALGLSLIFFELYAGIDGGKEKLFIKLQNYLHNEYPSYIITQREKEQSLKLITRINELEKQVEQLQKRSLNVGEEKEGSLEANLEGNLDLEERDIAYLLEYLSL